MINNPAIAAPNIKPRLCPRYDKENTFSLSSGFEASIINASKEGPSRLANKPASTKKTTINVPGWMNAHDKKKTILILSNIMIIFFLLNRSASLPPMTLAGINKNATPTDTNAIVVAEYPILVLKIKVNIGHIKAPIFVTTLAINITHIDFDIP